ncbi:hypothetical protein GCM10007907_15530 [Chitinimonas prasina]|uniref:Phosphoglycerate mutase n=1 Tax=Chitinimonas prasina TaxID=1434937 RepID=A0ABQ5YE62_9NEIS|nr:hypothetical protein [Chitinimonas prasina]GLR12763.1 hypothetical protein GCM10007907_15530 [Chitinimonas prasina]
MKLTLLVPDLRFARQAGFDPVVEMTLPGLSSLLGRAGRQLQPATTMEDWLRQQFGAEDCGAAALTLPMDLPGAAAGHWLRADPVHLRADRDRALLFDASLLAINQAEAVALVSALNNLYADDGYQFVAATPNRWYLRLPEAPDFTTTPLARVVGQDVHAHLPKGPTALRWHRLLNELQMLLYTQPVNDAREQAGRPTINSIWLWGEGIAPQGLAKPCDRLIGNDALACGLAQAAGVGSQVLPAGWKAVGTGHTLICLDQLVASARQGDIHAWREALQQLERDWFQPLLAAWQAGEVDAIDMVLPGAQQTLQASLRRGDRWKLWRRPVLLRDCLAEAA